MAVLDPDIAPNITAAKNRGIGKAARQPADQGIGEPEQLFDQPGPLHQEARIDMKNGIAISVYLFTKLKNERKIALSG